MAMEPAEHNIGDFTTSPAVVETPIYKTLIAPAEMDNVLAEFDDSHPVVRINTPDNIMLLSNNYSSWITGTITAGRN